MNENGYVRFLERQGLSPNGITNRKRNANTVMNIIGRDLDVIVADDEEMYKAIIELQRIDNLAHAPLQNALRKYYAFKNGKEFPKVSDYENRR